MLPRPHLKSDRQQKSPSCERSGNRVETQHGNGGENVGNTPNMQPRQISFVKLRTLSNFYPNVDPKNTSDGKQVRKDVAAPPPRLLTSANYNAPIRRRTSTPLAVPFTTLASSGLGVRAPRLSLGQPGSAAAASIFQAEARGDSQHKLGRPTSMPPGVKGPIRIFPSGLTVATARSPATTRSPATSSSNEGEDYRRGMKREETSSDQNDECSPPKKNCTEVRAYKDSIF